MDRRVLIDKDLQPGPFISYSRSDQEFVRHLHDSLRSRGRDTWVDWQGILPTEEWMAKIKAAIDAAQAFVFILSPASIVSAVCREEINHAVAQNKRLIPIVARDVDAAGAHEALRKLNWIYIRPTDEFEHKVDELVEAMDLDLGWVREQSRLLVRAGEWEHGQRENSVLLRGQELKDAERWLLSCGQEPKRQATAQQIEYIVVSRQLENRRRTVIFGATIAALVIAIGLGIIAWIQRNNAKFEAAVALSRQLAAQSEMVRSQRADMLPLSLLLAVESMARSPIHALEADQAVRHAWETMPRVVARLPHDDAVVGVAYSADGVRLATVTAGGAAKVWNAATGQPVGAGWTSGDNAVAIAFLPGDAKSLITASRTSLQVWNADMGQKRGPALDAPPGRVMGLALSVDGRHVASLGQANEVRVWDLATGSGQAIAVIALSGRPNEQIETSGAFSPDGRYFATTRRGTLKVFEVGDWQRPVADITLPAGGPVLPVAFSPDNTFLAVKLGSAVQLRRVREWGSVIASLESPDQVRGTAWKVPLAISASGRYVAAATGDEVATIWDVESGKAVATVRQEGKLVALHFSPRLDALIATCGEDGTARTWTVVGKREVGRMTHGEVVRAIAFSPNAAFLATAGADKAAVIWESTARPDLAAVEDPAEIARVWISPSGPCLWAASGFDNGRGGSVLSHCWDGTDMDLLRIPADGQLTSFASTSDGRFIAGSLGEAAMVWDTAERRQVARVEHVPPLDWTAIEKRRGPRRADFEFQRMKEAGSVRVTSLSNDGRYLVTTRADGFVRVWDTRGSREVLSVPQELSTEIALSPRGTRAAMTVGPEGNTQGEAGEGDTVRVFNLSADGEPQLLRHPRAVKQMFFGIDERTLVTVEAGNKGRTWNVDGRGREMTSFPHFGFIPPQLSRDGKYLLSRSDIEHVRVWDAMAGHPVTAALPVVPAGDPSAFAFSPDAKRFAFGTTKGNVSVVGLPGGQVIAEMSHAGEVSALAFSSDGKYLLSGSQDSTARILSIDDNREVARVSHPGPVRDVSFSAADGSRFLATASNEMARASLWRPADLRHEACRRVPSALPDGVWSPYLGSARPLGCVTVGQHVPH